MPSSSSATTVPRGSSSSPPPQARQSKKKMIRICWHITYRLLLITPSFLFIHRILRYGIMQQFDSKDYTSLILQSNNNVSSVAVAIRKQDDGKNTYNNDSKKSAVDSVKETIEQSAMPLLPHFSTTDAINTITITDSNILMLGSQHPILPGGQTLFLESFGVYLTQNVHDCNLILYEGIPPRRIKSPETSVDTTTSKVLWQSDCTSTTNNTVIGKNDYYTSLQGDGHLITRIGTPSKKGKTVWKNKTPGNSKEEHYLAFDSNNSRLVVYRGTPKKSHPQVGELLWSSSSQTPIITTEQEQQELSTTYTSSLAKLAVTPIWNCRTKNKKEQQQQEKLIFIHIFKTAGSTLRHFFATYASKCKGAGWACIIGCSNAKVETIMNSNRQLKNPNWDPCFLKNTVTRNGKHVLIGRGKVNSTFLEKETDIYGGHMRLGSGDWLQTRDGSDELVKNRYVTFFRDATTKYISARIYSARTKITTKEEIIKHIKLVVTTARSKGEYSDGYFKYLITPTQKKENSKLSTEKMMQFVQHNLVHYNVVAGLLERMPESMQILQHILDHEKIMTPVFNYFGMDEESKKKKKRRKRRQRRLQEQHGSSGSNSSSSRKLVAWNQATVVGSNKSTILLSLMLKEWNF
ncbi:hypothetical protein FRACYDRAFT_248600 [Fragilariopsis cylindrus CCMP1102]|uniref:Uncharacterized protein n=1 Tax=Fragilariopsis cylindrus CCMP1102 TaxID=635003 RepID=A0A1E7ETZ0_9STRA|nr:hypothetical protein FRACYDRAFT_248600 [Fragilariopsis cylindrus CCMP1102]|eukprot:OEU09264.1 hypothetical protein FRACYDRAFT_248600 [Fragilariopsis cylindrus CCMP1102]